MPVVGPVSRRGGLVTLALPAAIAAAALVAYLPSLDGEFLNWDDDRNFLENEAYRGLGWAQVCWAWSTYHLGVWQPLSWMLLGLEYAIGGLVPRTYHLTSLLLHSAVGVALYFLILAVLRRSQEDAVPTSGMKFAACVAAILFVAHPLRAEAVCWISCQPYLLASLLCVLAVLAYLRAHRPAEATAYGWLAVCFVFFLAALASKAIAVSLPAILLILDAYPLGRIGGRAGWKSSETLRALAEKIPFFAVAVVVSRWAVAAKDFADSRAPLHDFDTATRLAQAAYGAWFYLLKSAAPLSLTAYYRLTEDVHLANWRYGAAAALGLAAIVMLFASLRKRPGVAAAGAIYLVVLTPNLGLVQISQQLVADRYAYLAMIAPSVLLAALLVRQGDIPRSASVAGRAMIGVSVMAAMVALVVLSRRQARTWLDSETLWRTVIAADADCSVGHCNLGEALAARGRFVEASRHLSRAIDLDAELAFAYTNLGAILCQARDFDEAIACGQKALSIRPGLRGMDLARTHAMLGQAHAGLKHDEPAWRHTREAQRLGLKEAEKMLEYLSRVSREPPASQRGPP